MSKFWPLCLIIISISLTSCHKKTASDKIVASVGKVNLTMAKLVSAIPPVFDSPEDSTVYVNEFIRRWAMREILFQRAASNVSTETDDIERAVNEYRQSLFIETYQNKLIEQKFSPSISEKEIEDYYNSMISNFVLREPIIKGVYAVIPEMSPDIAKFEKALIKLDDESSTEVETYLYKNSSNYKISADTWVPLSSVRKFWPANTISDNVTTLKNNRLNKLKQDGNIYILRVSEAMPAGATAPLEFVQKDIYTTLLSKKKLEFLSNANKEIYDQAIKDNIIKFYDNND